MIANGNMKNPYLLKTEWRIIVCNCTFQAERVKFQLFIQKENFCIIPHSGGATNFLLFFVLFSSPFYYFFFI